jgi:hypothetical protein
MGRRATADTCLASLVRMGMPLCKQAERECPRTGPGRKPTIPDWVLAVLLMVAVLKRSKAKSFCPSSTCEAGGEEQPTVGEDKRWSHSTNGSSRCSS